MEREKKWSECVDNADDCELLIEFLEDCDYGPPFHSIYINRKLRQSNINNCTACAAYSARVLSAAKISVPV